MISVWLGIRFASRLQIVNVYRAYHLQPGQTQPFLSLEENERNQMRDRLLDWNRDVLEKVSIISDAVQLSYSLRKRGLVCSSKARAKISRFI